MIVGVGVDLVEIARIEELVVKHGAGVVERVFSQAEWDFCRNRKNRIQCLAARFAVKEAVAKAFGCGIGAQLAFADIEVQNLASGAPEVLLNTPIQKLLAEKNASAIKISLSHTATNATAIAIIF